MSDEGHETERDRLGDSHITKPTAWTVFLRTFVPWQIWRFVRINLKMLRIIRGRP